MSWETIFAGLTLVYLVGGGVISYWVNSISTNQKDCVQAQQRLADDLKDLEVKLPNDYVKKEDINSRLDRIDEILDKIFDKLDKKADK
jgi:outer membrane murein-binding lipoprotein Lpp